MKMPVPLGHAVSSDQDDAAMSTSEWPHSWQSHDQPEDPRENLGFRAVKCSKENNSDIEEDTMAKALQRMKAAQRSLLPSAEFLEQPVTEDFPRKSLSPIPDATEIERPRSALHSGDFRESQKSAFGNNNQRLPTPEPTSPHLWYTQPSPLASEWRPRQSAEKEPQRRSRAPSVGSLSSSFVLFPSTSPLARQATSTDSEIPDDGFLGLGATVDKTTRRRTLPPESFRAFESPSSPQVHFNSSRPAIPMRRERSLPYQAHQPRRSISSMHSFHAPSNPQTPLNRSRRPSLSSDISPLHASMVGSFEESILRGRMSTTPSKPLDFIAKIGVLGRGDCSPRLHCPPHKTISFSAVFYSYPELIGRRSVADDSPSPYVGSIDLEHNLEPPLRQNKSRRRPVRDRSDEDSHIPDVSPLDWASVTPLRDRQSRSKKARRSRSPPMPPGGCYRIPREGQLQIMIKTPNNTAVKLFLVPYNLESMEPGTKTFIRQRSYSTGPVVEASTSSTSSNSPAKVDAKPVLRYLIHLMICCPSKGRFYLYDHIRVVFANRVPDGKERLQNDVQYPDPKYSPYKPGRDTPGSSGAKLSADLARRRSSAHAVNPYQPGSHHDMDMVDTLGSQLAIPFSLPTRAQNLNAESLHWNPTAIPTSSAADFWTPSTFNSDQTPPIPRQSDFHNPWLPPGDSVADTSRKSPQHHHHQYPGRSSSGDGGRATAEGGPRQQYEGGPRQQYGDGQSSLLARQLKELDADLVRSVGEWRGCGSQQMQ